MKLDIITPEPHSKRQRLIMNAFENPETQEIWVACGTKFGKSLSASAALVYSAPKVRQSLWRWVAPIYLQSKIGYKYVSRQLPGSPYVDATESNLTISIPSLDTMIQFFHGQYPESLEGEAVHGYILDECAKMKEQVYASARTTTTVTRGKFLPISTPNGKNWFYKKCMQAKDRMLFDIKRGKIPEQIFITAPTAANPHVPRESILEARRNLPERLFRQYYLAEFVDDGSVFVGFRDLIYGDEMAFDNQAYQYFIHPNAHEKRVVIGIDWAKKMDYTVMTAWTYDEPDSPPRMIGGVRFQGINYMDAIKEFILFAMKFKEVTLVRYDATGIGDVIGDMLIRTNYPIEGIIFTNQSKSSMVNTLMMGFQKDEARLPYWTEMISELDAYEVRVNELGRMMYSAPLGQHDDIVSSMILGYSGATELSQRSFEVRTVDSQFSADSLDRWFKNMMNDIEEDD